MHSTLLAYKKFFIPVLIVDFHSENILPCIFYLPTVTQWPLWFLFYLNVQILHKFECINYFFITLFFYAILPLHQSRFSLLPTNSYSHSPVVDPGRLHTVLIWNTGKKKERIERKARCNCIKHIKKYIGIYTLYSPFLIKIWKCKHFHLFGYYILERSSKAFTTQGLCFLHSGT